MCYADIRRHPLVQQINPLAQASAIQAQHHGMFSHQDMLCTHAHTATLIAAVQKVECNNVTVIYIAPYALPHMHCPIYIASYTLPHIHCPRSPVVQA